MKLVNLKGTVQELLKAKGIIPYERVEEVQKEDGGGPRDRYFVLQPRVGAGPTLGLPAYHHLISLHDK